MIFLQPYSSLYWGRSPVKAGGKQLYSALEAKDRKKNLEDIDEKSFPEPPTPPPIPETKGDVRMLMPRTIFRPRPSPPGKRARLAYDRPPEYPGGRSDARSLCLIRG